MTINDGIDAHICLGCGAVVRGAMLVLLLAGVEISGEGERPNWSDLCSLLFFWSFGPVNKVAWKPGSVRVSPASLVWD